MKNAEAKNDEISDVAEPMVTVAVYGTPYEAGLAKSELEFYDIPVFLADEYTIGINSLYANALGGIKVNVPESCAEYACRILRQELLPEEEELMNDFESSTQPFPKSLAWLYLLLGASGMVGFIMMLLRT
ncbi:DUF2007 domain-containing protein [Trichlorobacter lovleyi]|jgi:hypothetical protein|uniref:Uncharacterized protein n=1 Tax=Trichlorobacter lovleyi (strain ATCC BAA-1151 / DSM 17278 / SZ) TaxID=398767 RepID=B3E5Q3_TRIL1|nr:DUF2007 domain-containing protein [Trichlorobacter lovleyi]ACD96144.1 hypothetical protein Glov_2430 [Trichlorobacter lovleyi SZ]